MTVLRDRTAEFEAAGVKPYGISRDSPWSHVAWAQVLDLGDIPLLSDWNGEAMQAFGVEQDYRGMRGVAERSAFLVDRDGIIRGAWRYALGDFPDFDELVSAARSLS
jgi:peroxiredoxin